MFTFTTRKLRILLGIAALWFGTGSFVHAQEKKADAKKEVVPLATSQLTTKDWMKAATTPLAKGEIDRLVDANLKKSNIQAMPLTSDEQFLRRVWLDLTGRLPMPADVVEFLGDKSPDKRAKLIDKLLDSDDFARHWALYFREVITSRTTDARATGFARSFEKWLTAQFKANKSWDAITRDLLTASGEMRYDDPDKNPQAFFLASRTGADSATELAAETSRIFLGIQIQCAQCHDHPSDIWKREQFHQFAAYFARVRERILFENKKFVGQSVVSLPFGEHRMPDPENPKKGATITPKFIDGKGPSKVKFSLSDADRRKSLADAVVSKDNPWFAGAFSNRIWGALMGQSFYQPIDDMGPQKEVVMPEVLARIAGSFRGSNYDIKGLFREILNSSTYQRQIRPGESSDEHLLFAANNPTRLSSNALWQSLNDTLGDLNATGKFGGGKGFGGGPFGRSFGLEGTFKQEFAFDPSTKSDEVEGSVSQALLMMNNPQLNQKIQAKGTNLLARILSSYSDDDEAVRMVYMRTLARRPTDRELSRCKEHLRAVTSRTEAYEDILWALINSTEYQTKR